MKKKTNKSKIWELRKMEAAVAEDNIYLMINNAIPKDKADESSSSEDEDSGSSDSGSKSNSDDSSEVTVTISASKPSSSNIVRMKASKQGKKPVV